ncbi:WD40-repeat-containing domain protein [Trichophaea hybrida]|nr:WD40-repeat-containing domain protein [Trichophaea hybrida]
MPAFAVPFAIHLNIPSLLPGIFEPILRAVPKKKQSHSRKRMRQLAGKALKDVTALNKCSACGRVKRAHVLCEHCVNLLPQSHVFDIFGLAITPSYVITVSGDSNIKLWDTGSQDHTLLHQFPGAHRLGAHHVAVNTATGKLAATGGFGGEIVLWDLENLKEIHRIRGQKGKTDCLRAGIEGTWALALSPRGDRLVATTCDGKINVWDTSKPQQILNQYLTKGSFGMTVDISPDGNLIASGHENGGVYIFNNVTSKIHHSLHGLVKPVRCVKFSPAGKLLAACGDSTVIALFDVLSGEQIANLTGHSSWVFSVAWNPVGDHLISGSFDGKVKVWSVDTFSCVATQNEATAAVHTVQSIPRGSGIGEGFVAAGANKNIYYYRETTGE